MNRLNFVLLSKPSSGHSSSGGKLMYLCSLESSHRSNERFKPTNTVVYWSQWFFYVQGC